MVMEVGEFGSTRWTSNTARPFAPAPGAGLGRVRRSSGLRGYHNTGFAADELVPVTEFVFENQRVTVPSTFTVRRKPLESGLIPSMLVRMRYTDRGTLTKARLDADVYDFIKRAGYKVSRASSFDPTPVTWRWQAEAPGAVGAPQVFSQEQAPAGAYYQPVVATPPELAGIKYFGSQLAGLLSSPEPAVLNRMPSEMYIYTFAVTSSRNTMSDAEAAQALTLIKQAMVNMASARGYATVEATLLGSPSNVFPEEPSVMLGLSPLILLAAWNMISSHVGSERL